MRKRGARASSRTDDCSMTISGQMVPVFLLAGLQPASAFATSFNWWMKDHSEHCLSAGLASRLKPRKSRLRVSVSLAFDPTSSNWWQSQKPAEDRQTSEGQHPVPCRCLEIAIAAAKLTRVSQMPHLQPNSNRGEPGDRIPRIG